MNERFSDLVREYIFAEMRLADARLKAKALDDRAATATEWPRAD